MKYERFYDVRKKLETTGNKFDVESLRRVSFGDLDLAGVGNAGEARCDFILINSEKDRRLESVDDMTPEQIVADMGKWERIDDTHMIYAALQRKVGDRKFTVESAPKWVLLAHYMQKLRGDWSYFRDSPYLEQIYDLLPEAEKEGIVPLGWLKAVKGNADEFDGHYTDGRIMRDGQLYIDPEVGERFGLKSTSVSGNLAKMLGAVPVAKKGFYGGYEELFEEILTPSQKLDYLTPIEGLDD